MENRYAAARRSAERHPDFLDLIDTNFHSCGFHYPVEEMRRTADGYFYAGDESHYSPDAAGDPDLRLAISAFYRQAGLHVSPEMIVVTASASESYSHIFAARCAPGDRILLPRPGYPLFEDIAARNGLHVDFYDQQGSAAWRIDPDQLESQVTPRTAAIVLISPNNPTGSVVSEETILKVGELCSRHRLFLVVDEVFSEILFAPGPASGDPVQLPRPARLLPDLVVYTINGVSKLFAAPDLKVSWIVISGPDSQRAERVEQILIQNDLFLSSSSLSQSIAAEMLSAGLEFSRLMTREISVRRSVILGEIDRMDGLSAIAPAGGIHLPISILPDVVPAGHDDERIAVELLRDYRVAVHPGYLYGFEERVIVVSYLAPELRIRGGMARLEAYLSAFRR